MKIVYIASMNITMLWKDTRTETKPLYWLYGNETLTDMINSYNESRENGASYEELMTRNFE